MESLSLQTFIAQRLAELSKEESGVAERLRQIRAEKERLRKAAVAAGVEMEMFIDQNSLFEKRTPKKLKGKTIKEAVMEILKEFPQGLSALNILQHLNSKSGVVFSRASLSPQLSRLKHEKRITAVDGIWILNRKEGTVDWEQPELDYPAKETKPSKL